MPWVMPRIEVEAKANIIPRESGQTSDWSLIARKSCRTFEGGQANDDQCGWCGLRLGSGLARY